MFEATHLQCTERGRLYLKLCTGWAHVTDAVDFDFGTVSDPAWPEELGHEPDWFFAEVTQLWRERAEWLAERRVA